MKSYIAVSETQYKKLLDDGEWPQQAPLQEEAEAEASARLIATTYGSAYVLLARPVVRYQRQVVSERLER